MFRKFLLITIFVFLLLFLLPQLSSAAGLVPCGRSEDDPSTLGINEAQECTICHFFFLAQLIITDMAVLAFSMAAIVIVIGGIIILTSGGSPEKVSQGKKTITYAVIGVMVILFGWLIVNEVMLVLVGTGMGQGVQKLPWPWNKITCGEPQGSGNGGGGGDGDGGTTPLTNRYCVCETPRYAYKGVGDSFDTVIGKDIRVTELADGNTCQTGCVSANFKQYCSTPIINLSSDKYNLYCATKDETENVQVCRLHVTDEGAGFGCRLGTECYNSDDECMNAAMTTYKSKCYLDSSSLCDSYQKGFSTFCLKGSQKGLCGSDPNKYVLYRWRTEQPINPAQYPAGSFNAYDCSRYAYDGSEYYCRLNCQYEQCRE